MLSAKYQGASFVNYGRLLTITTVALPHTFGWLFSKSRGASPKIRLLRIWSGGTMGF